MKSVLVLYNWEVSRHLGVLGQFCLKNHTWKLKKSFFNYTNSSCTLFNQNYPNAPKCSGFPNCKGLLCVLRLSTKLNMNVSNRKIGLDKKETFEV